MAVIAMGQSHVGCVKTQNEDNWLVSSLNKDTRVLLVADGVSGSKHGEVASQQVVDTFTQLIDSGKLAPAGDVGMRSLALSMAVQRAHNEISKKGQANTDYRFMACTCIVAIADQAQVSLQQVGDSRLYHLHKGELIQKSEDQTVVAQLLAQDRISEEAVARHPDRNTLAQALGVEFLNRPMEPQQLEFEWQQGDTLLLCSDGLSDLVSDQDICTILTQPEAQVRRVDQLIQAALDAGGKDNITVILAENK